jgi:hypothetical protein
MQACHTCDAGMQRPGNPHFFIVVAEDDSASAILAQALRNRYVFEFSLCLSRACLGKKAVLYINGSKRPVLLTSIRNPSGWFGSLKFPAETCLFFKFFLSLSRACVGKLVSFNIKWCKKDVSAPSISSIRALAAACKECGVLV